MEHAEMLGTIPTCKRNPHCLPNSIAKSVSKASSIMVQRHKHRDFFVTEPCSCSQSFKRQTRTLHEKDSIAWEMMISHRFRKGPCKTIEAHFHYQLTSNHANNMSWSLLSTSAHILSVLFFFPLLLSQQLQSWNFITNKSYDTQTLLEKLATSETCHAIPKAFQHVLFKPQKYICYYNVMSPAMIVLVSMCSPMSTSPRTGVTAGTYASMPPKPK